MGKNLMTIALAIVAISAAPSLKAGTEVIEDLSGSAPRYNYAPQPPPVYYAAPPVRVVVYPTYGVYYGPRYGIYPHSRVVVRRGHWHHHR